MTRIIIADDHIVLREGLCALINEVSGFDVVSQASDGFEAIKEVKKHLPDVVILDLQMPKLGGMETLDRLKKIENPPLVLILSAYEDESIATEAIKKGAKGFLTKQTTKDELEFAINSILRGQTYISQNLLGPVNSLLESKTENPLSLLTSREREVMKLLSEGHKNKEVAKILHISPRTIDSHRANIMKKLGVQSNAELTQLAIKTGLIV